jgi:hypothetical protein
MLYAFFTAQVRLHQVMVASMQAMSRLPLYLSIMEEQPRP